MQSWVLAKGRDSLGLKRAKRQESSFRLDLGWVDHESALAKRERAVV